MNGVREMNKAAFRINVAETMFYQQAGLLKGGLSVEVVGDAFIFSSSTMPRSNDFDPSFQEVRQFAATAPAKYSWSTCSQFPSS